MDNDLVPWDDDIDLAADAVNADKIETLLLELIKNIDDRVLWSIKKCVDVSGRTLHFLITFSPQTGFDFKPFPISIAMKGVEDGMAIKLSTFGALSTPAFHTDTLNTFVWNGNHIYIPSDCDGYLSFLYGDWRIPKQDFSAFKGENWKTVPVEKITQAQVTSHLLYTTNTIQQP